jgi:hypothetical protein
MPAVTKSAPPNPVPIRQAEVGRVVLAAITFPLRLTLHLAFPSDPSRPMAALMMPVQSREAPDRPAPGTNSSPFPAGSLQLMTQKG